MAGSSSGLTSYLCDSGRLAIMKVIRRGHRALAGVVLAVIAGSASFGAVAMTSSHASTGNAAAVTLPTSLTTDPGATLGGIDFFNSSGVQITTGSLTAPFAAFAVIQNAPGTAPSFKKLVENVYTPVNGVLPANWSGGQLAHASTAYPVATSATSSAAMYVNLRMQFLQSSSEMRTDLGRASCGVRKGDVKPT